MEGRITFRQIHHETKHLLVSVIINLCHNILSSYVFKEIDENISSRLPVCEWS